MRIILTGGGTGGHIFPALAIATALKERGADILFLGTRKGLEAQLVPRAGFPLSFVAARGLSSHPFRAFRALGSLGIGYMQSLAKIMRFKPSLVVGTGGYVSAPVACAAHTLKIPIVLLEQNTIPGKTTRFLKWPGTYVSALRRPRATCRLQRWW